MRTKEHYEPEDLYPALRAENAQVGLNPHDLKYGTLLVGGQGSGKSSALLSFYRNAAIRPAAATIVLDPKSEFATACLHATPPDETDKQVWYLDLGHPAFGMSPLTLVGDRPLAIEAAQIADNVVAALLDINENQIFQSSRRYLYHAVIGAISLAHRQGRRAKFEDVYTLLRPGKDQFRFEVAAACADASDLDQTAEFFESELPDDLRMATSRVAERLDAPRNKISGLTGVPPLRRFFNHPTEIPLREIIEARDILIIDGNFGAIGTENGKTCLLFILRMLHTQMQRQVHLPEDDRPTVSLLVDEAHYIVGENVIDQIAAHRAAGLEPAFAVQYLAQLGSGSEHQQKILKGVLNLLQSRFLFRIGDPDDAEQTTRIAMAVYSTMIRDDPDSRARLRVTPEQILNFPNYFCLASWIAKGTRIPCFIGQTYPMPPLGDEWADHHLDQQAQRVSPYPEQLPATLEHDQPIPPARDHQTVADRPRGDIAEKPQWHREYLTVPYADKESAKQLGARWDADRRCWYVPAGRDPAPFDRWRTATSQSAPRYPKPTTDTADTPPTNGNGKGVVPTQSQANESPAGLEPPPASANPEPTQPRREAPANQDLQRREVRINYEPPAEPPELDTSPVRQIVGLPAPDTPRRDPAAPAPDSLRELAYLDRINEIGDTDCLDGAAKLPRLYDVDYTILALLDRAGLLPRTLIAEASMPDRSSNAVIDRLTKLYRHGLIAQHPTGLREHASTDGRPPRLYSLTRRGLEVAQQRQPPAISTRRDWRAIEGGRALRLAHDLHALSWGVQLHHLVGDAATDHWRTPRYATGRFPVPQAGSGRDRHPIANNEIPVADGQMIIDLELKQFAEIKPDLSLELKIQTIALSFDLLVELDLTARPSYNHDKLAAYDAFLCGWALAHRRFQTQGTRPAVVFVCSDAKTTLALAQEADEVMTGRIGQMGTPAEHWYHAGRDHTFFAVEADIYHGDLSALALAPSPPGLRQRLTGTRELQLTRVLLLPDKLKTRR
jgi:hypothetical protein